MTAIATPSPTEQMRHCYSHFSEHILPHHLTTASEPCSSGQITPLGTNGASDVESILLLQVGALQHIHPLG